MKKIIAIVTIILLLHIFNSKKLFSQVSPDISSLNEKFYDFKLERVIEFLPAKSYQVLKEKFGEGFLYNRSEENVELRRYDIKDDRYTLVVFIQIYQSIVIDTHIIFPTYFLHDSLLKSLIKVFGRNTLYWHEDQASVYQWKNAQDSELNYAGSCTIYCFPIYLSAKYLKEFPELEEFRPLLHQMSDIQRED